MSAASDQITQYLSVGGLFNPEMMNQTQHEAVRDTLIKARDDIQRLESENAKLRDTVEQWKCRYYDVADEICRESNGIEDLCRQARALRADKSRLDWLEANLYTLYASGLRCNESPAVEIAARSGRFEAESIRAAIDAARKEAQP